MLPRNKKLRNHSSKLRNNATKQENKLWYQYLAKSPIRFVRQKPIDNYIVDFYCPVKKLVIEIDGSQHYTDDGLEYDEIRSDLFVCLGLHVIRFTNEEIDFSFDKVCEVIQSYLDSQSN